MKCPHCSAECNPTYGVVSYVCQRCGRDVFYTQHNMPSSNTYEDGFYFGIKCAAETLRRRGRMHHKHKRDAIKRGFPNVAKISKRWAEESFEAAKVVEGNRLLVGEDAVGKAAAKPIAHCLGRMAGRSYGVRMIMNNTAASESIQITTNANCTSVLIRVWDDDGQSTIGLQPGGALLLAKELKKLAERVQDNITERGLE